MAMYYGYGVTGPQKMYTEAMNEAFGEIRRKVRDDALHINDALEQAGLLYQWHPQTIQPQR